jgi:serine/threonine protein kinase
MGEVYEVEHGALGKRCAVKVLHRRHRDRSDLAVRMREEARALASLHHPALVDVFDLGVTSDGRPYFAMELLVGRDLRRELSRFGVIAVPAALRLMAEALGGLEAAHRAGIVHRDIKLENLFLCDSGSLKVLDFGIAKVLGSGGSLTDHGSVVGTARSMAPEQHEGGPVDGRTDVYAAGLALYELVAGRGPFDELRTNARAMRLAHCERSPLPPSRLAAQPIPHAVDEAILRSLAKRPADRFQSAGEMADVLRSLTGGRRSGPSRRGEGLLLPAAASRARSRGELRGLLTSGAAAVGSAIGRIFPLRS